MNPPWTGLVPSASGGPDEIAIGVLNQELTDFRFRPVRYHLSSSPPNNASRCLQPFQRGLEAGDTGTARSGH